MSVFLANAVGIAMCLLAAVLAAMSLVPAYAAVRLLRRASRPATTAAGSARRYRLLLERWRRSGALTPAGYDALWRLMDAGADAYPYWSGGETCGTSCVWAHGRRWTLAEWNAEAAALATSAAGGMDRGERGEGARHE